MAGKRYRIEDAPVVLTCCTPGLALIYDALEELEVGKSAVFAASDLTSCVSRNDIINSVGRMVRTVRARHFPRQHHRNQLIGGEVWVTRTV